MVVRVGVTTGRHARGDYWPRLHVTVLLAGIAVLPAPTRSASSSLTGSPIPVSPFDLNSSVPGPKQQTKVFDPTAASLSSMLGFEGTSVIAPIFLYPATSLTLDVPGGGSAEEFGVGSGDAGGGSRGARGASRGGGSGGAGVESSGVVNGLTGGVATISGAEKGLQAITTVQGSKPLCSNIPMTPQLQVRAAFWDALGVSATTPARFPPGVFAGMDAPNPLGLDPSGNNPLNFSPPGPAGGWCRPGLTPFFESSPLESPIFWIVAATINVAVVVFLLSRGIKLPAESWSRKFEQ